MKHFTLFVICLLSVEVLIRSNYIASINSIINVSKKAIYIILNEKISNHWKENIIPAYSLQVMRSSLRMAVILLLMLLLFIIGDYLSKGLISFAFSSIGILESLLFAFGYAYLRRKIAKCIITHGWSKSCIN